MKQESANHEVELVKSFILPSKRSRYLSLLESKKGRKKFLNALDHFDELDPRHLITLSPNRQTAEHIEKVLKQKGAPLFCHVMSSNDEIDGQDIPLQEALIQVIGRGMGTFISCIPGKLAYFEGEEESERFILQWV
jgi:hypothetical protein